MFSRRISTNIISLINKQKLTTSRCFSYVRSSNELIPFDYDSVPSDFDSQVYRDILEQEDAFGVNKLVSLKELFDNRCHLGHKTGSLNEYMKPYIFGHRQDIAIFDLNQTVEHLKKALNFTAQMAFRGAIFLMINQSRETANIIEKTAIECGEYSQCRNFNPLTFEKPEVFFKTPVRLPDVVILFRTKTNNFDVHSAIKHSAQNLMPSIGIVDSDCDPRLITYPVPGNDDTPCAIELYARLFKEAILLGKQKKNELIGATKPEKLN